MLLAKLGVMNPFAHPLGKARALLEQKLRGQIGRVLPGTPEREGLAFEDLRLPTSDGQTIAAWYLPGDVQRPAFALVHHFGGQRATLLPWIRLLQEEGHAVVAIDLRGHGHSPYTPGGQRGLVSCAPDMQAACDLLVSRGHRALVVLGQSQGCVPTLITAAARQDVRAVVLDCGPAPTMAHASFGLARAMTSGRNAPAPFYKVLPLAMFMIAQGVSLAQGAQVYGALYALRSRPLLWVHGDADDVIRRQDAGLWFHLLRSARWQAHRVRGGVHVRSAQTDPEGVRAAMRGLLASL